METTIRVLLVEDSDEDATALLRELGHGGYDVEYQRVDTPIAMSNALLEKNWDIVIADYEVSRFSGKDALNIFKRARVDCPFIMLFETVSDDIGVAAMKAGAHDYLMKENLRRLAPIIAREVEQTEIRRQQKRANERLQHIAYHDLTTDLPNSVFFHETLAQGILKAQHEKSQLALLLIKIIRFRELNEALGDQLCDVLLIQFGRRLDSESHRSLTVACLRSNEFAVLILAPDGAIAAQQTIGEIITNLERPFIIGDGLKLDIQVRFGIAVFPQHATVADLLVRRARTALADAQKKNSTYAFYSLKQSETRQHQLTLFSDLRRAIVENELFLVYQPIVDLRTLRVVGAEALVRWNRPGIGILAPDRFIPFAEQTGLIMPLALWVLNEALRQCNLWNQKGLQIAVAVNVSPSNLESSELPKQIVGLLASASIPPSQLELEITESATVANPRQATEIITRLKNIGLRISIDDFGTGYSCLAHLQRLPIDAIKIDKSFVIDMATNTQGSVIVRPARQPAPAPERAWPGWDNCGRRARRRRPGRSIRWLH